MRNKREFEGGYCRAEGVQALIRARAAGDIGKSELRLFFALLEHQECKGRAPVDVILNRERKQKKRMTDGQQERGKERLMTAIEEHKGEGEYHVKLPRKFVRVAARGALEVSEMLTALCYFMRRMPQRSKRKCLVKSERYCRLSVRTIRELTGLCHDAIVGALRFLRTKKLIALVWRPMVEIKRYGSLFVDGAAISINYHKPERTRASSPSSRVAERPKTGTVAPKDRNGDIITPPKNSFIGFGNGKRGVIAAFAAKFCPEHELATAYSR